MCGEMPATWLRTILAAKDGNVIDAAIATVFCNGLLTMQSMGIGGGFIMNIWFHNERKAYTLNAKEWAPQESSKQWYKIPISRMKGPLSIAVPGEVAGLWELFKRFSHRSWAELIKPTILLCENGFKLTKHMADFFDSTMKTQMHFRETFIDKVTGEFHPIGTHILPPRKLCQFYRMLAQNGGEDFYNGSIANLIVADLQEMGSLINKMDLMRYKVKWSESIQIDVGNDNIIYVPAPPSSAVIIPFVLNILQSKDPTTMEQNKTLLYHRIAEAFKFAYAERCKLGDPDFCNHINQVINDLKSQYYATVIKKKISNFRTHSDPNFYGNACQSMADYGTSHISIIAPNKDAVSVSSSLNFYYGCGIWTNRTAMLFNSGIDDFSFTSSRNYFDLPVALENYIQPYKRAVTSMSPTILTDRMGNVKIVIGAAGGSKIPTAIILTLFRLLELQYNVKKAIDAPRIHHQLDPMILEYEYGITQDIVNELERIGHKTMRYRNRGSIVNVLVRKPEGTIVACVDYRKSGMVAGF